MSPDAISLASTLSRLSAEDGASGGIGLGTWPDWLAAAGTSAAFVIAALAYGRDVRTRQVAQARSVYAELSAAAEYEPGDVMSVPSPSVLTASDFSLRRDASGGQNMTAQKRLLQHSITIHNMSDDMIGPVHAWVHDSGLDAPYTSDTLSFGRVLPHQSETWTLVQLNRLPPGGSPAVDIHIRFRDASGKWWQRSQSGPVIRAAELIGRGSEDRARSRSQRVGLAHEMGLVPGSIPAKWRGVLENYPIRSRGRRPE